MGGGGLGVYNALPCAKIYSIYLPMAGSPWTMQYCQKVASGDAATKDDPKSAVLQLEAGLVPPDLDMDSRYDFKRVPVPPGKSQKLIVLKGTLLADGTVDAMQVYQGVVPQMDDAARAAFSRWKFKPAKRDGKAVPLEILVGIPTDAGKGGGTQ
jgi:TonB family protein